MTKLSSAQIHQKVEQILGEFSHDSLKKNLIELNALKKCVDLDDQLFIELEMPFFWENGFLNLQNFATNLLKNALNLKQIHWSLQYKIATIKPKNEQSLIRGVKNIIAVSSGKGGVGKSTVSVNLAFTLSKNGIKVGVLDADIYGPSIPLMLGTKNERPTSPDGKHMSPIEAHNLQTNSIGYLIDDENATIWRGPMASKALLQLLQDTLWRDLDYLILDMPPGTGDIQLTLAQSIPIGGAIIVTTPQEIALADVLKGIIMFEKTNVSLLGIIENMSYFCCENCNHHDFIFGKTGAESIAKTHNLPLLGKLPLNREIMEDLDSGNPRLIRNETHEVAQIYQQIATKMSAELFWNGLILPEKIDFTSIN